MITDIYIRNKLRTASGLTGIPLPSAEDKILNQNWSTQFVTYMKNRMMFGFYRYGSMVGKKTDYDNIHSIEQRIQLYKKTGNDEILIDCANLCMCEFANGEHPNKHFNAEDDGIHTKKRK